MKTCTKCGETKPLEKFGNDSRYAGGKKSHCNKCLSEYVSSRKRGTARASYDHMLDRCNNPNNPRFDQYGGRGIKVCQRWTDSYDNFIEDVGERPGADYSIDRIDVNGDYTPANCKWSTSSEQARNRRTNVWLTIGSETMLVSEWNDKLGFPRDLLSRRLRHGWDLERAISTPVDTSKQTRKVIQ